MPGPTGFICCSQGWSFSNLAVIGQSYPWRKNSPSLHVSAFSCWKISTGMFGLCPVGSGIFVGPNRSINDIISHPVVEQRAAMFKFKMKKHLYHTETYFSMAHQHYCLRRRKSSLFIQKRRKLLTSYTLCNIMAPFTTRGINRKKILTFQSDLGVLKSPNKQKTIFSASGRNPLLKVCHVSACWV